MEESNNKYASKFMPTFNPLHPNICMYILHTVLYISQGADRENLCNNQDLQLVISSHILMT